MVPSPERAGAVWRGLCEPREQPWQNYQFLSTADVLATCKQHALSSRAFSPWLHTLQKPHKTPCGRAATLCHPSTSPAAPGQRLTPRQDPATAAAAFQLLGPSRTVCCVHKGAELGTVPRRERSVFCHPTATPAGGLWFVKMLCLPKGCHGRGEAAGEAGGLSGNH